MKTKIKKLFKQIKLLVLDVDGVLTKGEIIYDDTGKELKVFNVKDGLGINLLGKAGIPTVFLTAKDGQVVRHRAKDIGVKDVFAGVLPKESVLNEIQKRYSVTADQICFIGDDLIDIGMIKRVGLGIAVADALSAVKKHALYITKKKGGEGAVREVADILINAQKLEKTISDWLENPKK